MFISALCPTYRRPRLLENAIAQFTNQDYPADRCELLILDDAQQIPSQRGENWRVISSPRRYPSLPEKYAALAAMTHPQSEVLVIWDDDDVYLPWHLSAHAQALAVGQWSKPTSVLTTYTGKPREERGDGRFFASIAVRKELWRQVGGIPLTDRADFDLQFLKTLKDTAGEPVDTKRYGHNQVPGYCYRWGSTGHYHSSAGVQSHDDVLWYKKIQQATPPEPVDRLLPNFDAETLAVYFAFMD